MGRGMIAYSWDASFFFWSHPISFTLWLKRVEKHFYPLILTLIHCVVAVLQFFLQVDENISRCSKIAIIAPQQGVAVGEVWQ